MVATNSTIPGLPDAVTVTPSYSLAASDGAGLDVELPVTVLRKYTNAGIRSFPILAQAMSPSVVGGCAALARIATSANHPDIASLDFDATTQEFAQFACTMPKDWDRGTITATFKWSHSATTINFGVKWGIQAVAVGDGDSIDAAYGTAQEVADTGGATNVKYWTQATSALTVAGSPQAEDTIYFRFYRLPSDSADNLAVDARLEEVKIYYTTNAADEA